MFIFGGALYAVGKIISIIGLLIIVACFLNRQ